MDMDMSTEDRQTATDHLLSTNANPETNVDVNQNSFPIDSSILDPALDFAMPAPNPSDSDTTTPNFLSSASNAFLAAINRFTVAIAPKSDGGTPHAMASDIPVPSQLKANSNPDEDAPHEEDEGSSDVDPRFADAASQNQPGQSLSSLFAQASAPSEGSMTPISEARMVTNGIRARTSSATPSNKEPSSNRRKRGSSERITPRKPSVRIKPPEQLAAEALIEQQNPNATKNQLRSLKLRALHAGRIAERELGMSEEEKTRRLRLREYVRHKREEERAEKAKAPTLTSGDGPKTETKDKPANFPVDANLVAQSRDPKLFAVPATSRPTGTETRSSVGPSKPAAVPIPEWQDPALSTPQRNLVLHMGPPASAPTTSQADSSKRKRASLDNPTGSEPRRKYYSRVKTPEQSSIEAQIERDHPNATKNQLKSLKLRALHAGRIAERERDMPEKEKARRLKLREYMRRRREDERGEARLEPLTPQQVIPPPRTATQARPRSQLQPRPEPSNLRSTELNAADHSAAFSIMELTNTFQHQFQQPQQTPSIQTNHNLHLHPLFQMPGASTPSTQLAPQYDPTIDQNYALPNVWSDLQQHRPSISTSTHGETSNNGLIADDLVESALHAALQEACKAHNPADDDRMQFDQGESSSGVNGSTGNPDRVAAMEQERIRIAEEEILGVERARIADAEMALIAAAAAEVEKAHLFGNESLPPIIKNEESG
ncbi:uncharacterized protein MELLADRAFT_101794 [Melampsora larici-populina 98AG31]|uniref:Uncharacterized protein n=1 Tax=Melampsora larici-populina (strain 98AG31 / pathotype 3-4-7) TaxID=747676 RepID=F4R701_MELLP|nr:uncharacterized protein MELLADRAFT_101794 [Melampsora larici-populina 98AG31]EGG11959.1 hypothetical protein MELLADRAFT_101794 [Melampsora larici-populina 98AG31]